MVDIENYIVDYIQTKFTEAGVNVFVDSVLQPFPSEFPCVTVREVHNTSLEGSMDDYSSERHVFVIYQVDIIVADKPIKEQCKNLMNIADQAMRSLKFARTTCEISASEDRTLAWGTMRYRAIVGSPKTVGDNQVYQMYR